MRRIVSTAVGALLALLAPGGVAAAVVAVVVGSGQSPAGAATGTAPVDRVLVVSYPRLTWALVAEVQPPTLLGLLQRGAAASMSVQAAAEQTDAADGYLTLGAGNRADAGGDEEQGEVALQRGGGEAGGGEAGEVLVAAAGELQRRNDDLLYGAETGALGETLAAAGRSSAVVANADVVDGAELVLRRAAALAMMDASGHTAGSVAPDLAVVDPTAPGERRVDEAAVVAAFGTVWRSGAVVTVEMSDLDRAGRAGSDLALAEALRRSDALLAALLADVDLARDLVVIVAPVAPGDAAELTVFGMVGPGVATGSARSPTTRRDGYVTLPDVAPTVLAALGVPVPDAMTGTAITAAEGSPVDPVARTRLDARSSFRERAVVPMTVVFLAAQLTVCGATVLAFRRPRWRPVLKVGMLALLAFPAVTFLSGSLRYDRLGLAGYGAALLLVALAVAVVVHVLLARHVLVAPLVIVGATWLLLAVDAVRGGGLQLDTPFGYSPITAARFAGMGNLGLALLMVSAIVVASGLWPRWPGVGLAPEPRPDRAPTALLAVAGALFVVSVVVDGLPGMGADLGGVLAMIPALTVCWFVLAGRRVSWPRVALLVAAAVLAVLCFALVDLSRPDAERTHVGRFAQRVLDGDAWLILQRKVTANVHVITNPGVVFVTVLMAVAATLAWQRSEPFARVRQRVPGVRAALVGSAVGAVLGFGVNDSGIVVPGMMLAVLVPWFAHLAFAIVPATPLGGARASHGELR